MARLTLRLDDVTIETLNTRAEKKGINSSEYVRSLIELGMRIEDANNAKEKEQNALAEISAIDKQIFHYVAETLLVVKNVFANSAKDSQNVDTMLKNFREKANAHAAEQLEQFSAKTTEIA